MSLVPLEEQAQNKAKERTMRIIVFAATGTAILCHSCASEQFSWNQVAGVERHGHVWEWDRRAMLVLDRGSEQPCTVCQHDAAPLDETAEYLLLYIYRVVKFLKAYRDLSASGGTYVDEVMNLVSERFPEETEAIQADISRLVD